MRPRSDTKRSREGVFAMRSPDRPNPIGLHVVIESVEEAITVRSLETIDGTPVLDVNPSSAGRTSGDAARSEKRPG